MTEAPSLTMAVLVPLLDEERHLERLLASLEAQSRRPDALVLIDDGSRDRSLEIVDGFAASRDWVEVVRRPRRPKAADRLAEAPEYQAFQAAVARVAHHDVIAKLDADLDLPPDILAVMESEMLADERLGIVGAFLSVAQKDGMRRERHPAYHVRGATKFYRRACYEQLEPLPAILGWDTIDEVKARMHGWRTRSVAVPSGDPVHLRTTGSADGLLRGYARWGGCAAAAGYHPLWIALGAARRVTERPFVVAAGAYAWGWARALLRGVPRAEPEVRRYLRREQKARIVRALVPARSTGTDSDYSM